MPAVSIERTSDEAVIVMSWHDILVVWFKGAATTENLREAEQIGNRFTAHWARGYGMMVAIDEQTPAPSQTIRREINGIYARWTPRLRGVSYLVLGHGLQASVTRSVLTAMNWVTRRAYPTSITSDVKKGATWLFYTLEEDAERGTVEPFLAALDAAVRGEAPQTLRTGKQSTKK